MHSSRFDLSSFMLGVALMAAVVLVFALPAILDVVLSIWMLL